MTLGIDIGQYYRTELTSDKCNTLSHKSSVFFFTETKQDHHANRYVELNGCELDKQALRSAWNFLFVFMTILLTEQIAKSISKLLLHITVLLFF